MKSIQAERITVPYLLSLKSKLRSGAAKKIAALTAYDFTLARIIDQAGVDVILVGDSVSAVVQGVETTLPVTLDEMIYHCRCVSRAVERALLVGDMPFMSYQVSIEKALEAAGRMLKEGGAAAVKLEGGVHIAETIARLVQVDIPVMGHVGLTPQSFHRMGGHKIQGKSASAHDNNQAGSAARILEDALAVEQAGAFALVIEGVPAELAAEITNKLSIPTIGIGAGPDVDGQILVAHDMLGMYPNFKPSFLKHYADLHCEITKAVRNYIGEVRLGQFPEEKHSQLSVQKAGGRTHA